MGLKSKKWGLQLSREYIKMGSRLWVASSTHPAKVDTSSPPPHNIIFLVASLILKLIKHGMCCNPGNIKLGMCKESRTPRQNCITTLISSLYLKSLCVQVPSSQDYYKLSSNSHITFIITTTNHFIEVTGQLDKSFLFNSSYLI